MGFDILFRVIGRISEDARIKASSYSVEAHDDDPMYVRLDKFVIQENTPLLMKELPPTMGEKGFVRTLAANVFSGEILEFVWQL